MPPPFPTATQLTREPCSSLAIRYNVPDTSAGWLVKLQDDLKTNILDDLYSHLWLVARKEGSHVDALHVQLIKRRSVIVAEDPKLHLVWNYDVIYIKPLPEYLLNYNFWETHLVRSPTGPAADAKQPRFNTYRSALGFLRSYSFLIQHESDFVVAQRACLIPKYVSFHRWQRFIQPFRLIADDDVSHRYHYGQFRLTRLNIMTHIVRVAKALSLVKTNEQVPWEYQEQIWQTGQYLSIYAAPFVLIFAMLSLILSSMQVVLAARGSETWEAFVKVSWGFSVATIIFSVVPILGVMVVVAVVLVAQGQFALRMRWKDLALKKRQAAANSTATTA